MDILLFIGFLYFFFDFIIENEKEERRRNGKTRHKKYTTKTTF